MPTVLAVLVMPTVPTVLVVPIAQDDPTGLSSPAGTLVSAIILIGTLVVLIRWWVQLRRRDHDHDDHDDDS